MDRDVEARFEEYERRISELEERLKTFISNPREEDLGSANKALAGITLKGHGYVSRVSLGSDGESLDVKKVR